MQFRCNGTITGVLLALQNNPAADIYPEVQLWRETLKSIYTKIARISLAAARRTRDLNIYKLDLEEPTPFKEGDVIGLFLPQKNHSKFVVQTTLTGGESTNLTLSYWQTSVDEEIDLSNTSTQLMRDHNVPMMVFEIGKYISIIMYYLRDFRC